jgi:hypothetical protein
VALSTAASALPPSYGQGGLGWDETNLEVGFEPTNRVGADPASGQPAATLAQTSLGLQSGGPTLHEQAAQAGRGDFQLRVPLVRLAGRGLDLALDLTYNARLWRRGAGNDITFDPDAGWPAPGWSVGFGKLLAVHWGEENGHPWSQSKLYEPDGTEHATRWLSERDLGSGDIRTKWQTTDGSRIDYIEDHHSQSRHPFYAAAKYPNGTTVEFTVRDQRDVRVLHPTRITDADGNFITITYRNNRAPEIDKIIDTLNREIVFKPDGSGRLGSVEVPELGGGRRTSARLSYTTVQLDAPFAGLNINNGRGASVQAIQAIYYDGFPGPGAGTAYWFGDTGPPSPGGKSYSSYGMLRKVSLRRDMVFDAASGTIKSRDPKHILVTREQVYDYPEGPDPNLRACLKPCSGREHAL